MFSYILLFSLKTYIFQVVPVKDIVVCEALSVEQISEMKLIIIVNSVFTILRTQNDCLYMPLCLLV